ncbi:acyl-CoA dehydrogenase family protein, partial [Streptomyces umbrinus]
MDESTGAVVAALAQFVCGFHDLDLRDTVGPGHGRMILNYGSDGLSGTWAARLGAGELVGIAATERHGGSRLPEITTRAVEGRGGWRLTGEKCWVSRLEEASAFVVFFKDPGGRIEAAVVGADAPGVSRRPERPAGLGGWAWGSLVLRDVPVSREDVLWAPGGGDEIFRSHFAVFRPLVAATALGTAAGVHSRVLRTLKARTSTGLVPRVRDTALVALGRTHAELYGGLLSAVTAARLSALGSPVGDVWAREVKAHGVETALGVVQEIAPLVGAS